MQQMWCKYCIKETSVITKKRFNIAVISFWFAICIPIILFYIFLGSYSSYWIVSLITITLLVVLLVRNVKFRTSDTACSNCKNFYASPMKSAFDKISVNKES